MAEQASEWLQGHSRGLGASVAGGNDFSEALGMNPASSVLADAQLCDESLFRNYYRAWAQRMAPVLS
jgi:benzoate/toluate 1,2-dioxygenase alpha subunit